MDRLLKHVIGQLDAKQYGGIKGRTTTLALIDLLHHWYQAIDESKYVGPIRNI
jgi:hypothetical protein